MSALSVIVDELKTLPPKELEAAALFIHDLKVKRKHEKDQMLHDTAGSLSGSNAEAFAHAIEDCEKIDGENW